METHQLPTQVSDLVESTTYQCLVGIVLHYGEYAVELMRGDTTSSDLRLKYFPGLSLHAYREQPS
jgi:hypothetical protein